MEQKLLDDWVQNEWLQCMKPYINERDFYIDNPHLSLKLIENNMESNWNWAKLSELQWITAKFAFTHLSKTWDWHEIVSKPDFTINMINDQNKSCWKRLNWGYICEHRSVDIEYVNEHMDIMWDWHKLSSMEKFVTSQNLLKYPNMPWDWLCIGYHFADVMDMDVIGHFSDKPWHPFGLSRNPNLSLEIFTKIAKFANTVIYRCKFENDANGYVSSRQIRISLAFVLEFYETAKQSQLSTIYEGDFIFSNNYLVKNIMNFL